MVRPRNVGRVKRTKPVPDWEQEEFESRTDIKLAALEVTDIGEQLSELPDSQLKKIELSEQILDAIKFLRNLPKGPGRARHKKFLGGLLRKDEDSLAEARAALEEIKQKNQQQNLHFQRLEKLRDNLIKQGDEGLNSLLEDFPNADRQYLRQQIRQAAKEAEQEKPAKAAREIFKYLRGLDWG